VLGPSEGELGGQDSPDGFPASGRNAYPPGASAFFADAAVGARTRVHTGLFPTRNDWFCALVRETK